MKGKIWKFTKYFLVGWFILAIIVAIVGNGNESAVQQEQLGEESKLPASDFWKYYLPDADATIRLFTSEHSDDSFGIKTQLVKRVSANEFTVEIFTLIPDSDGGTGGVTFGSRRYNIQGTQVVRTNFKGRSTFGLTEKSEPLVVFSGPIQPEAMLKLGEWHDSPSKVVKTNLSLETKAGVLNDCIKVSHHGDTWSLESFYCKGVGVVKEVVLEKGKMSDQTFITRIISPTEAQVKLLHELVDEGLNKSRFAKDKYKELLLSF